MKSIKWKIGLSFLLVTLIPVLLLGYFTYTRTTEMIVRSFEENNANIVSEIKTSTEAMMGAYQDSIQILGTSGTVTKFPKSQEDISKMKMELKKYWDSKPQIQSLYLGMEDKSMHKPGAPEGYYDEYDPTGRPWYIKAKESKKTIWTEPYQDFSTKQMVVTVATPVFDASGAMIGVIGMDISLDSLSKRMNEIVIGQYGYPVLVDSMMKIMTHKDVELINQPIPVEAVVTALSENEEGVVEYRFENTHKFAVFSKMQNLGWTVLVTMDEEEVNILTRPILFITIIVGLVSLFTGGIIATVQSSRIVKPIKSLEQVIENVKNGDFKIRSSVQSNDEIGHMSSNFNDMMEQITKLLTTTQQITGNVLASSESLSSNALEASASSEEVANTVESIASGASDQAGQVNSGLEKVNNLADGLQNLKRISQGMIEETKEVSQSSQRGNQVMKELKDKTYENNAATERVSVAIGGLESKSNEIGGILSTITEISSQTNLLALNASIEAARAGEHGRGFAVVAEEIRKLAEETSASADSINEIVTQIQNESNQTVFVMKEVSERSVEQSYAVEKMSQAIDQIGNSVGKIAGTIARVTESIEVLNQDKDGIVLSMEEISSVSQETAASTQEITASVEVQYSTIEEVASAAEQLKIMADDLEKEMRWFKL